MENLDIFGSSLLDFSSANSTIAIQFKWELQIVISFETLKTCIYFPKGKFLAVVTNKHINLANRIA